MLLRRIASDVAHPIQTYRRALALTNPSRLWRRYADLCARAGLTGPVFILSMDCDTERDIQVVEEVHTKLLDRGIMTIYAVPGELLEKGSATYGRVAASGAEFLNHGHRQHTRFDETTAEYRSFFFYDRLPPEVIQADIEKGHESVKLVLGRTPKGFRTPHFGSFQKAAQLSRLHSLLAPMGYRFSTSTMPGKAIWDGPASQRYGLYEIPVTGCRDWPLRILDSWSFRFAPGRRLGEEDYILQAQKLADLLDEGGPCLINLYADPSQVHDWPEFFDVMGRFAAHNVGSYDDLLDRVAG